MTPTAKDQRIWTIGHSTHDVDTFIDLLRAEEIVQIADVRRFPGSKRHPQFGWRNLRRSLTEAGIDYRHFVDLGGRRKERLPKSPNTAWRVESFNAYADYMQTPQFLAAVAELAATAQQRPTAMMCAEALPWRCHRRIVADFLIACGWTVIDILSRGTTRRRKLTEFAKVEDGRVTYPGEMLF